MLTEKTWVYWLGLLTDTTTRFPITQLLGSLVFLAVGVYVMISDIWNC